MIQHQITFPAKRRGLHLITDEITQAVPEIASVQAGLHHLFLLHTSASLTVNENADPDVLVDFESALNRIAPDEVPYLHTMEGRDDMPAHVKSSVLGCSLTIPIRARQLALGTWQGIYLCEHRDRATPRQLILTLWS